MIQNHSGRCSEHSWIDFETNQNFRKFSKFSPKVAKIDGLWENWLIYRVQNPNTDTAATLTGQAQATLTGQAKTTLTGQVQATPRRQAQAI